MSALAEAHDAAVQMIDTSIVRVHQHGACMTRNRRQSMGRSRGGLTSKIHALVDTNGLPVRLALTAGEEHDNRLAGKLLSRLRPGAMLLADRGYDADWIRTLATEKGAWANIPPRSNRNDPICFSPYLRAPRPALGALVLPAAPEPTSNTLRGRSGQRVPGPPRTVSTGVGSPGMDSSY
jgi:transposase